MNLSNFFPSDTLSLELPSSTSVIAIGVCTLLFPAYMSNTVIIGYGHPVFWGLVLIMLGVLHLISIILFARIGPLRSILNWLSGIFWIYTSISLMSCLHVVAAIPLFFMGISNLYAFILNFLVFRQSWK